MKIKNANACYTGGGIYIYYGELENGLFFRACDDWDFIEICDADTSTEDADYPEFYDEHEKEVIAGDDFKVFWDRMLLWIIHWGTDGNYDSYDLEKRLLITVKEEERFEYSLTRDEMKIIREALYTMMTTKEGKEKEEYYHLARRFEEDDE